MGWTDGQSRPWTGPQRPGKRRDLREMVAPFGESYRWEFGRYRYFPLGRLKSAASCFAACDPW